MQPSAAIEFAGSSRFKVRARVGEGSVGVVYDAVDRERDARVAIKTLRSPSPETIHLLKTEFRRLADLRHPNLVALGELFEEHGTWFFTMEFVPGVTLLRYVRPGSQSRSSVAPPASGAVVLADPGRLDEGRLRAAFGQLALGLAALHDAGKIHRDVKPSNVLVTPEGRVVILDFGLVAEARGHVADQGIQGTVPYMAPEQAASEEVGFAADWYAMGVVLYQALTGRLPFYGSASEILEQKVSREPPPPRELVPDTPDDLNRLCVDLLRIEAGDRPTQADILARLHVGVERAAPPVPAGRLVGREREQAMLREAFAEVEQGRAATVFVHGESGVGKSFLVRNFADDLAAERPNTMVLSGRCYERESVTYKAVDGIIDALSERLVMLPQSEVDGLLPAHVALLAQVFPVLGKVEAVAARSSDKPEVASPNQLRAYVFAALRQLLDAVARRQPLVLTIDDLQWADNDSLALIAEVMRPPSAPPLLLVATLRVSTESHRPTHAPPPPAIDVGAGARHLYLEHLSDADAERLVMQLLDQLPNGDELRGAVRSIVDDTRGHPLFIDELVRQGGSLARRSSPPRLDDALWRRVAQLDSMSRHVLEIVATAGLPMPQSVIAHASATEPGDLYGAVATLRAEHLVRTSGVGQKDFIEPYHDRVREVVVAHLKPSAKKDWHGRLALALESWSGADPEALSIHWDAAGHAERARQYAIAAADAAGHALAFERSARLYRRALELTEGADTRKAIETKLAEALTNAGQWTQAAEMRLALARGADATTALDFRRRAAEQLMCSGHFDRGVEVLREALLECGLRDPRSSVGLLVSLLFYRVILALRGLKYAERAPTDEDRSEHVRADTVRSAGAGFSMTDNVRGAYYQTRNLIMVLRTGDAHRIARALCMEICFSSTGGEPRRASTQAMLRSAHALCDRVGTGEALGMAATAEGYAYYFRAEWPKASEWLARAEEVFRDRCVGATFEVNSVRMMLYRTLAYRGEVQELRGRVPPVLREAEAHNDVYTRINLWAGALTLLGLVDDEPATVAREVDGVSKFLAQSRFLVQHYFCMVARSQVELYEGQGALAHERVEAAWPGLRRSLMMRVSAIRIAAIEQRGRCALAAGLARKDNTLVRFAEAQAAHLQRESYPWARGSAMLLRAGVRSAQGDRAAARGLVERAVVHFDETHMSLYAAVARRCLGAVAEGTTGAPARAASDAWMTVQGVKDPAKLSRMIAPGFEPE